MLADAMDDEALLRKAAGGDRTAFLLLYERHRVAIYRFACQMLCNIELAEDVTHDCFLGLMKQPQRFNPQAGSLRTYLFGAARNLALKHFRDNAGSVSIVDLKIEPRAKKEHGPLNKLIEGEIAAKVQSAIADLPVLQREALILFEYQEMSLAEIAVIVEADIGTVKSRLFRAREQLRRALSPYFKSGLDAAAAEK
jgi:RNA polymerase sigma-70 factor (ECF subfamily)